MSKEQFKEQCRNERRAARRTRRAEAYALWARGMLMLRGILYQERAKLQAIAAADWRMERIRRNA